MTVLSFSEDDAWDRTSAERASLGPSVTFIEPVSHPVHIRHNPAYLAKVFLISLCLGLPYVAAKFYDRHMFREIDRQLEDRDWDVVFIDYLNMAPYGRYIRSRDRNRVRAYLFKDHNLEFDIVRQEGDRSRGLARLMLALEWRRTRRYERINAGAFDAVFAVTPADAAVLREWNPRTTTMAPVFDMRAVSRRPRSERRVLFVASLSWKPNRDGLAWFIERVWPLVLAVVPDAQLDVVGSGASFIERMPSVTVHGYADDLDAFYACASVMVVPLFAGGGIRIKILEAFNAEVPVVSTSVGAASLGARDGQDLLIADDPADFAAFVARLLSDQGAASQIARDAKRFLSERYSVEARAAEVREVLDGLLPASRTSRVNRPSRDSRRDCS